MVLHACHPDELVARLRAVPLLAQTDIETLRLVAEVSRVLCLEGGEVLAQQGTVLPAFCLALSGSLVSAGDNRSFGWTHPGHIAAGAALPEAVLAGPDGADCLYVELPSFLDLVETEPPWTVAMVKAVQGGGPWR